MSADSVILSPHFDDAVLSCWHLLAGTDEVLVVNVFAGEPGSGALGWWDRLAGASDSAAAVRARVEEDRRALARIGRTAINLPFLDSQYRDGDQAVAEIVDALHEAPVADARVYAPASLGDHHPDHRAVRSAALALHAEGADVTLYADLPHATLLGWPRWVLNGGSSGDDPAGEQWASQLQATGVAPERMSPSARRLEAEEHERKLEAVLTYATQIAPLEQIFGASLEDPELLGFEVDWRLPRLLA
jgi:LmbE family N-acetylglucosaminyl deacetylase